MNQDLFSPIELGGLRLANRVVMAPLTRNRAGEGGAPTDLNVEYYRQRASAGLIISEASQISPAGVGYPNTPGIHSQAQIAAWRRVTEVVRARGGHMFIQLWHCGRISHPSMIPADCEPLAPSPIKADGEAMTYDGPQAFVMPRAMTHEDIAEVIEQFRCAALNAKAAGFDGIELHAANGYLIDQFLRDGSNQREDEYGGSPRNRMRFLLEIIDAVSTVWESGRIGVRISPENAFNSMHDGDPQTTFAHVAAALADRGLAYLHVLEGDMASGARRIDYQAIKQAFGGAYVANNGYTRARALEAVARGQADMVAFGQLFISNPDLPRRLRENAPLNEADPATFYGGDAHGYTDYPALPESAVA